MDKKLLTYEETARITGIGRTKLIEYVLSGRIPSIRLGKSRRIVASELDAWIRRELAEQSGVPTDERSSSGR